MTYLITYIIARQNFANKVHVVNKKNEKAEMKFKKKSYQCNYFYS